MALVVTLALVVLVAAVVLAFFTRATANRLVESSRTSGVKVDQLASSSSDYVIGNFLQEIRNTTNSTVRTTNNISIYAPLTADKAIPSRMLSGGISLTDTNFYNLIRQSLPSADTNASSANSSAVAKNGRYIAASRWNAPVLVSGLGFANATQAPNWIYVNKDGSVTNVGSADTIGRFAYNVYDIGGLLDANVAGYPTTVTSAELPVIKGRLSGADLSQIPGVLDANAFVTWRNPFTTTTSSGGYVTNSYKAATNNFTEAIPGDNRFISRQDLIKYARETAAPGIDTNALPYLTTFSRALNAPSYTPPALDLGTPTQDPLKRYPVQSQTPGLPAYGMDDSLNPSLVDVRVVNTATSRPDGTQPVLGEPLLKKRFPLSRLAGVGMDGPVAPATAATIKRDFGLVWNSSTRIWTYTSPTGGSNAATVIKPLSVVASEGREPDFFELLQSSIRVGSLGKSFGSNLRNMTGVPNFLETNTYYQIMQIGANLIDQYDANSYPVRLLFDGRDFCGTENLPYLSRIYLVNYESKDPVPPVPTSAQSVYIQPEVWNPHQQPPSSTGPAPSRFRFAAEGGWRWWMPDGSVPERTGTYSTSSRGLQFSGSPHYSNAPMILAPSPEGNAVSEVGMDSVTDNGNSFVGLLVTSFEARSADLSFFTGNPLEYHLQYLDTNGSWVNYSTISQNGTFALQNTGAAGIYAHGPAISKSDPRTQRLGHSQGGYNDFSTPTVYPTMGSFLSPASGPTVRPDYRNLGTAVYWQVMNDYTGVNYLHVVESFGGYLVGALTENKPGTALWYKDSDGVNRLADGAYSSGAYGQPLDLVNGSGGRLSRPIILDRPFRSVAEMGYAFRDLPWKSVDFFTANSGDAALLDAFCVDENSASALVAGVVNLNTRQKPVMKAILSQAIKEEFAPGSSSLSASEADTIATKVLGVTSATPLVNRSELVTKVMPQLVSGDFSAPDADAAIKFRREVVVRALADVGDTRTWNLFIDVISQTGKVPKGGGVAEGDFMVEGERRNWLSVAIDRYTGQVLEKKVEIPRE